MPYQSNTDLPESVRHHLPEHAQTIYREAYNNAHKQYADPSKRNNPSESMDAVCAQVAWAAVKKQYHKGADGKWVKN